MPTLANLPNCRITMYAADHLPPHFHVRMKDGREALVEIKTLVVLSGKVSRRELVDALEWAKNNQGVLHKHWKVLNP